MSSALRRGHGGQFLRWQRGFPIPSSAAFGKIGQAYVAEVHKFAKASGIPVRYFARGERKEEIARPFIEAAAAGGNSAVALIGIAQEKASAWRSWPARGSGARGTRTWSQGSGVFRECPLLS